MFRTASVVGEAARQKFAPECEAVHTGAPRICPMIGIFADPADREMRKSCGSDTLTFEHPTLNDAGAGFSISPSRNETGFCRRLRVRESRAIPQNGWRN